MRIDQQTTEQKINSRTEEPKPVNRNKKLLHRATNIFGAVRVLTYIPTILAIYSSASASQYSLTTWTVWIFANFTLALSIYDQNNNKVNGLVLANIANAIMCLITLFFIVYFKLNGQ